MYDDDLRRLCPQGNSNPRYRLERAASWAARRWGLASSEEHNTLSAALSPTLGRQHVVEETS
jgi:hypothetical protein